MAEEHRTYMTGDWGAPADDGLKIGDRARVVGYVVEPSYNGSEVTVLDLRTQHCAMVRNHTHGGRYQVWQIDFLVKIQDTQTGCAHDDTDGGMLDRDTAGLSQPLRAIVPAATPHAPAPWHLVEAAQDRRTLWGAR